MVSLDPVARKRLDTPYLLALPIFQSHRAMNRTISEIYASNQICGELSRVIVAPEFRGLRISSRLIEESLRASRNRGVQWLFLECLPIHERLYEQHGFRRISGVEGRVVGVGRTMITMERRLDTVSTVSGVLSQSATAGVR
jgi:predicted GNAT family N-acyltransferase